MNKQSVQKHIKKIGCIATAMVISVIIACSSVETTARNANVPGEAIALPQARTSGTMTVEEAMFRRRSVRSLSSQALTLEQVSQIMWSMQGVTGSDARFRTVPSAGALNGLEVFVAVRNVFGLSPGVYRYNPAAHSLVPVRQGDHNLEIMNATRQSWVNDAPAVFIIAGVISRLEGRYGDRSQRYVVLEAGHAGQNLSLQVVALGLATTAVGAFDDNQLRTAVGMSDAEAPLYVFPVGYPQL